MAAYTVIGFLVLPAVIKWQMRKRLPALTHRVAHIEQVRLNPFALSLTIRKFALTEPDGATFAGFDEFYVNVQLWASLFHRAFVFREIRLRQPEGHIICQKDGTFNFSNLIPTSSSAPAGSSKPPRVVITVFAIEEGALRFADFSRQQPFKQDYEPINLRLTNLSTLPQQHSPYSIVVVTPAGGTFEWSGDVSVNPPRSAGHFKLTGSKLKTYSPYAEEFAGLIIADGVLGVQADYQFDYSTGQLQLDVKNTGVELNSLKIASADNATSISLGQLAITGVEASVARETLRVTGVSLSGLTGTVQAGPAVRATVEDLAVAVTGIAADRRAGNLDMEEVKLTGGASGVVILPGKSDATAQAKTSSDNLFKVASDAFHELVKLIAKPLAVKINGVTFDKTGVRFTDESIEPHAAVRVDEITGRVQGLVWDGQTMASVELAGKVGGHAPFTVTGRLNPAAALAALDLSFTLKDNALLPGSPYAAKYVGFPMEQGTLSLNLQYHVTDRELKAQNSLRVDQLRFGAASGSPDAVKLPVKLAVALLQDRHGTIKLDVPVGGRLDDPEFHLGRIIMQVFMNILTKAVTKPFTLLASLIPGMGDADLSFMAFEPGQTDFVAGEVQKLDALATALEERPALNLEMSGTTDPVKDRQALSKQKLVQQIKERVIAELPAKQRVTASVPTYILDPKDYERLIWKLYEELVAAGKSPLPAAPVKQNFSSSRSATAAASEPAQLTPEVMEAQLIELQAVSDEDLAALAKQRADKVRAYLLQTGKMEEFRLAVGAPAQGQSRVALSVK